MAETPPGFALGYSHYALSGLIINGLDINGIF